MGNGLAQDTSWGFTVVIGYRCSHLKAWVRTENPIPSLDLELLARDLGFSLNTAQRPGFLQWPCRCLPSPPVPTSGSSQSHWSQRENPTGTPLCSHASLRSDVPLVLCCIDHRWKPDTVWEETSPEWEPQEQVDLRLVNTVMNKRWSEPGLPCWLLWYYLRKAMAWISTIWPFLHLMYFTLTSMPSTFSKAYHTWE